MMMEPPEKRIRRHYDLMASTYEQAIGHRQIAQLKALATNLPPNLPRPILDLGSGTGLLSKSLGLDVIAVDLSMRMLHHNVGPRIQADWSCLPFRDETFSTVFSMSALETSSDPLPKLLEMKRVLKIGGYFYLTVLKTEDLALVESQLRSLNFDGLKRGNALDAIFFKGVKGSDE